LEFAYRTDAWHDFYVAVADASAALTGLLFVSLSVNLRTIIKSPAHKARAREALAQMLSLLVPAVIMLLPGQSRQILGAELVVLGTILLTIILTIQSGRSFVWPRVSDTVGLAA
jgi:modulator of FtsH protease